MSACSRYRSLRMLTSTDDGYIGIYNRTLLRGISYENKPMRTHLLNSPTDATAFADGIVPSSHFQSKI